LVVALVYSREVGIAVCSREEVEESYGMGEAGSLFRKLMEYLRRVVEGT
jgi:hypothetical protein